jgi:hypothetical protein
MPGQAVALPTSHRGASVQHQTGMCSRQLAWNETNSVDASVQPGRVRALVQRRVPEVSQTPLQVQAVALVRLHPAKARPARQAPQRAQAEAAVLEPLRQVSDPRTQDPGSLVLAPRHARGSQPRHRVARARHPRHLAQHCLRSLSDLQLWPQRRRLERRLVTGPQPGATN